MKPLIKVSTAFFDKPLDIGTFDFYCAQLPDKEQKKLRSFRRWEDATASITGKILLIKMLENMGLGSIGLADIQYSEYNRPFINNTIDFNITHSGNCVACTVAVNAKVGIDIEQVREIAISDFKYVLTDKEYELVDTSADRNRTFYMIWTQKEAIVKADGCGLNIELNEIDSTVNPVSLNGEIWQVKQVKVANNYVMHLAYDNAETAIEQIIITL